MTHRPIDNQAPAGRLLFLVDAFLGSYSGLLFSHSRWAGALLCGATLLVPSVGIYGVVGALAAIGVAAALRFSPDQIRSGMYSYNSMLLSLGMRALFEPTPLLVFHTAVVVVAGVVVTAALNAALGRIFNVPSLTLPLVLVYCVALASAFSMPLQFSGPPSSANALFDTLFPVEINQFFRSLGAVLFLPRPQVGAMMLVAMLVASRISVVLAVLGFAVSRVMQHYVLVGLPEGLSLMVSCNAIMTAIAMGGVWFVPSASSFIFATVAATLCSVLAMAVHTILAPTRMPAAILPFNLSVLLLLYTMRQRVTDGLPKAVDVLIGSPEEHLNYFRTRVARFRARYFIPFSPPFLGRWICTQGVNGPRTHKGLWQHALDFEVVGADGRRFRGEGERVEDYLCYGLPVLAPADGQVVRVVDGIPDNPIGEANVDDNWGNLVILCHAPGLYSLLCHFAPGTIACEEGQFVKRGARIGACGNSGRSPIPHLHFHLQATPQLGAHTIDIELRDAVQCGEGERFHGSFVPREGERVRNLEPDPEIKRAFRFDDGMEMLFEVAGRTERLVAELDLYGNRVLRSPELGAALYHDQSHAVFTCYDAVGPRRSVLRLLHAALPRMPFEVNGTLEWSDSLTIKYLLPPVLRELADFISPFLPSHGVTIDYKASRCGDGIVVTGTSRLKGPGGRPAIETRLELSADRGIQRIVVAVWGRTREAKRQFAKDGQEQSWIPNSEAVA